MNSVSVHYLLGMVSSIDLIFVLVEITVSLQLETGFLCFMFGGGLPATRIVSFLLLKIMCCMLGGGLTRHHRTW